jgi:hypothetical protein
MLIRLHRQHILLPLSTLLVFAAFAGCGTGASESLSEVLSRYEQEDAIEYLTSARDVFRFRSLDAETRFMDERASALEIATSKQALSATDWFCYGSSSHTTDSAQLVTWTFYTRNDSTRTKREANVHGTIFHPGGLRMDCNASSNVSSNTCRIFSTVLSGYNSAVGTHECCEKRGAFGSYKCTNVFASSDQL